MTGGHGFFQTIFPANEIAEFTDLVIVPFVGNILMIVHKICCVKNQMAMDVILIDMSAGRIYDKIGDTAKAKVVLVTPHGTICSLSKKSLIDNKHKKMEEAVDE